MYVGMLVCWGVCVCVCVCVYARVRLGVVVGWVGEGNSFVAGEHRRQIEEVLC